jgi:hypothetical protein
MKTTCMYFHFCYIDCKEHNVFSSIDFHKNANILIHQEIQERLKLKGTNQLLIYTNNVNLLDKNITLKLSSC